MAPANPALIHPRLTATDGHAAAAPRHPATTSQAHARISFSVHDDFTAVEPEWRRFEQEADCTAFQCFDWLETWQRHVGAPAGVLPAIVIGRGQAGETLIILPLAVSRSGLARRLSFLGRDLCDYNAPLLAPGFDQTFGRDFVGVWQQILTLLQADPRYRHDLVVFDKMPEQVGAQRNPFTQLAVTLNPSGAYRTNLSGNWDAFYAARRSSQTRRRDRSKRRRLGEHGPIELVTPEPPEEAAQTLETLIGQKRRAFARMGVADLFSRPGYVDFFRDLAARPHDKRLVHVSRLEVGSTPAATNLGIEFRGVYYHVLASYDDGPMSRFGPGAIHLHDLMRRALERGDTVFDFTIGDEPYKRDWCDTEFKLYDLVAAASVRGFALAAALNLARSAKRSIKHSRLWPALVRMRSKFAGSARRHDSGDRNDD